MARGSNTGGAARGPTGADPLRGMQAYFGGPGQNIPMLRPMPELQQAPANSNIPPTNPTGLPQAAAMGRPTGARFPGQPTAAPMGPDVNPNYDWASAIMKGFGT